MDQEQLRIVVLHAGRVLLMNDGSMGVVLETGSHIRNFLEEAIISTWPILDKLECGLP
jgi:hypothetical protein